MRHGIVVFRVVRQSPADAAGVLPGDIVTHINGTEVQGDHSGCFKPPDDIKTKVLLSYRVLILKRNICLGVNERFDTLYSGAQGGQMATNRKI